MSCLRVASQFFRPGWSGAGFLLALAVLHPIQVPAQSLGTNDLPVVSVAALDAEVAENGGSPMRFLFSRTGSTTEPLTVFYQPAGLATNGVDFQRLSGRITIPSGTNAVILAVQPIDDTLGEALETVTLRLISSTNSFSVAILPDTQYYTGIPAGTTNAGYNGGTLAMFAKQTQWIVDHRDEWNIAFALHEGDCTENNVSAEWQNVRSCLDKLNGVVPYAIAMGNHDGLFNGQIDDFRNFNQFYPLSNSVAAATVGGVFQSNRLENCYHLFSAGGVDWLVFSLEFGPSDAVLNWANTVTTNYPDRKVILLTHAHLAADSTWLDASNTNGFHPEAPKAYGRPNDGVDVWEKFLRKHANIVFAFNGHIGHGGLGQLVSTGDHGNKVYQFACNYQFGAYGGAGFMRVLKFYPNQDKFEAQSFSPYFNQVYTDPKNQFTYTNLGIFTNIAPTYLISSASNTATILLASEDLRDIVASVSKVSAAGFPSRIQVRFDRAVTLESATNLAHYSLVTGPALAGAQLLADGRTVRLAPAANLNPNVQYQLIITGIHCVEPSAITNPPPITTNFVFNPVLVAGDFSDGTLGDWVVVDEGNIEAGSAWQGSNSGLAQFSNIYGPGAGFTSGRRGTFVYHSDPLALAWSNYVFTTTLRSADDDGIGVMFCYHNPQNYYKFDMDRQKNFRKLFRMLNGVETTLATENAGYVTGSNYLLNAQVSAAGITVTLAGQPLFGGLVPDTSLPSGSVALYSWGNTGSFFSNITVTPLVNFPLPQISFVTPTNNTQLTNTTPVTVVTTVVDPASVGISEVEYFANGTRVLRIFAPPYQGALAGLEGGNVQLDARVTDSLGRQNWAAPVQLNVITIPHLLHLWQGGQGQIQMEFRVQPTTPLTLQASSNLLTWESLGVLSNLSATPLSTLDPGGTNAPVRFYRAVPTP
jgi:hypothetical protein